MNTTAPVGIDAISVYCPHYYIDLKTLAAHRDFDADACYNGLGQEKMAVPPPGEDVVTMAANAAAQALEGMDRSGIGTVIFATESGIDQSKAGGIFVHGLLGLSPNCRVFEIKQACYGATAGLQMALPAVAADPDTSVLIVATDIARYGLGTAGEKTQGAGAIAMVVSANPRLVTIDCQSGFYTEDAMDFWRPNYRDEALVDGKASIRLYLKSLAACWKHYTAQTGRVFTDFDRFCYHLPFTRMAETAHARLAGKSTSKAIVAKQIENSLWYNRIMGNSYTASMYVALTCLLDHPDEELEGCALGLFSYGSGCMAEFFSGTVNRGYRSHLKTSIHSQMLSRRVELSYDEYEIFYTYALPTDGSDHDVPVYETGRFRLVASRGHRRIYGAVE